MTRPRIPDDVLTAAHERARARADQDWAEADRLRGVIEAAGWKIVDRGTDFALTPVAPPDVADAGRVRYGASANVPSRLDEPATDIATVVLVATDQPADLERAIAGLRAHAPAGTSVVIVADAPSDEQAAMLDEVASGPSGGAEAAETGSPSSRSGPASAWVTRRPPTPPSGGRPEPSSSSWTRASSRPATS